MRFPFALLVCMPAAALCPDRPGWPTRDWPDKTAETVKSRAAEIAALEEYAFNNPHPDESREGIRTDGVVIVKGGAIVYERYARGFDHTMRHIGWSVSKSVTNALTGVAVLHGGVSLDDSVCDHIEVSRSDACRVKLLHLLEWTSGFDWTESYENRTYQVSSVLAMLYGEGRRDMAAFVSGHKLRDEPGTAWSYSTGDSTLLAGAVDRAMRKRHGDDWAFRLLFDKIGMGRATLERDGKGTPVGGSHFWATPRDFARFGYLFLNDGCWAGERLLPDGWVRESTALTEVYRKKTRDQNPNDAPGKSWWTNRAVPEYGIERVWKSAPEDTYAALGHWGQSVTVIPSLDLVVVRTADDRKSGFEFDKFLSLAIAVGR